MLDSTVELLVGLCLIALPLMISFCIVGSIVATLRAVSQGRATVNMRRERITIAQGERKNWRESSKAAPASKILQDLNQVLKREDQVRRDFRKP
jgi:hypothetical protein